MSKTQNVKLGVCRVFYGGNDLGYTKGGVEVEVSTDTYAVMVDQFGESEINEYIQKRTVKVKCPLAETTLENMVNIMPGATLFDNGIKQISTVDIDAVSAGATESVTIDSVIYAYTMSATPDEGEVAIGLVAAINADASCPLIASTTSVVGNPTATIGLSAKSSGLLGAAIISVSSNLTFNEVVPASDGAKRVDVSNGIGTDLLAIAQKLVLHPKIKPYADKSEDFVIPKAATAGALQFAYKFDEERIFNVEFTGYPDTLNGDKLFHFGDEQAV